MKRSLYGFALVLSACHDPPATTSVPTTAPSTAGPTSAAVTAAAATSAAAPAPPRQTDKIPAKTCELQITPLKHATMLLKCGDVAIYADPVKDVRYDGLPKANIVLITDIHGDHMDPAGLERVVQSSTTIVAPPAVAAELPKDTKNLVVLKNGETQTVQGFAITGVPMYNLKRGPKEGTFFHDKGRGDGFIVAIGDKRVYLSGDTECTPEMKALKDIDVAFVCMNLPYTMPPSEAAECINAFKPKIVYPYHYRGSDLAELQKAVKPGVEVRVREWYPP